MQNAKTSEIYITWQSNNCFRYYYYTFCGPIVPSKPDRYRSIAINFSGSAMQSLCVRGVIVPVFTFTCKQSLFLCFFHSMFYYTAKQKRTQNKTGEKKIARIILFRHPHTFRMRIGFCSRASDKRK